MWGSEFKFWMIVVIAVIALWAYGFIWQQYQPSAHKKQGIGKMSPSPQLDTSRVSKVARGPARPSKEFLLQQVQNSPTAKIAYLCKCAPNSSSNVD